MELTPLPTLLESMTRNWIHPSWVVLNIFIFNLRITWKFTQFSPWFHEILNFPNREAGCWEGSQIPFSNVFSGVLSLVLAYSHWFPGKNPGLSDVGCPCSWLRGQNSVVFEVSSNGLGCSKLGLGHFQGRGIARAWRNSFIGSPSTPKCIPRLDFPPTGDFPTPKLLRLFPFSSTGRPPTVPGLIPPIWVSFPWNCEDRKRLSRSLGPFSRLLP